MTRQLYGRGTITLEPSWDERTSSTPDYWAVRDTVGTLLAMIELDQDYTIDTYGQALAALGLKRRRKASPVLELLHDANWDDHDPWGAGMSALGDVCDAMQALGEGDIVPLSCGYSPGITGGVTLEDIDSDDDDDASWISNGLRDLVAAYRAGKITALDLERAARILSRYLDVVRAAGRDY